MKIFISGGSGTLGKELCKQLYHKAKRIVVYSRDEAKQAEMKKIFPEGGATGPMRYRIGDVRDYPRLLDAMRGCDICIHAAALKRIEVCEYEIYEAVKTNLEGSINITKAAAKLGYKRAVLISTDKACDSISVYGTTKNLAERVFMGANNLSDCVFYSVRYGNVRGSRGSVHTIWEQAAKEGKPIQLTDPEMTRWFWSIEQAAKFVIGTLPYAQRGVIYVPKMRSYRLHDIAKEYSNNIEITGLRCNEKLHERMVSETESRTCYELKQCYAIHPIQVDYTVEPPRGRKVTSGFTYISNKTRDISDLL